VNVRIAITTNELEAALNFIPPEPSVYGKFLKKLARQDPGMQKFINRWIKNCGETSSNPSRFTSNYLCRAPTWVKGSEKPGQTFTMPQTISRPEKMTAQNALTSAYLRECVDEWLATGVRSNGSEFPRERNVKKSPGLDIKLWQYVHQNPKLALVEYRDEVRISFAERRWYRGPSNFFESRRHEAMRLFIGLIVGPMAANLGKCGYPPCGRYFFHPKPQKSYRHGMFCSRQHSSSASALACCKEVRSRAKRILAERAAELVVKQKWVEVDWKNDLVLKQKIAAHLCDVIASERLGGYRDQVRSNWVKRNCELIQERIDQLIHQRRG
jgi:hypothetical protein